MVETNSQSDEEQHISTSTLSGTSHELYNMKTLSPPSCFTLFSENKMESDDKFWAEKILDSNDTFVQQSYIMDLYFGVLSAGSAEVE